MDYAIRAASARTRLERGPWRRDRISLGRKDARSAIPRSPLSSSASRSTSSSPREPRWAPQSKPPQSSRSCSQWQTTRSVWLTAWHALAANVTGLSTQQPDRVGKRLELLREVLPGVRRLVIMANVSYPAAVQEMAEAEAAAATLGLDAIRSEIRRVADIVPAFDAIKGRADALYVAGDPLIITNRVRINTLALGARLPGTYSQREYVEAGGLMSYGPNFPDLFRRAGDYVDKILRGAKPAGIPVEQPTKFDLVVNLVAAKALGLTVPPTLLARADEVIE